MATEGQHTLTYLFHTLSLLKAQISPFAKVSQLHRRMLVKQTNDVWGETEQDSHKSTV